MRAWIWTCVALLLAPLALAEDRNSDRLSPPDLTLPLPHARNGELSTPTPLTPGDSIHLPSTLPPVEPSLPTSPTPSTESATRGPASTPRPDLVGIRGYRRFHANDSLIGRPIGCTHEEKLCFKYNLLYNIQFNGCYGLGKWFPFDGKLKGTIYEFTNGSSQLTGITYPDFCPGYRMAFDDICYNYDVVQHYICGCDAVPTLHILGGEECRCSPPTPIRVEQPAEEGKCRIPDLRFPEDRINYFQNTSNDIQRFMAKASSGKQSIFRFTCSSDQMECFSKNKVWLPEAMGCFPLLERGPCAEEHLVALDAHAAKEGRAEGTCVHEQGGCPQGHVRLDFDGQCHNADDVKITVAGYLARDPFGKFVVYRALTSLHIFIFVLSKEASPFSAHESDVHGSCALTARVPLYGFNFPPPVKPFCGSNDKHQCARYEAAVDIPEPDLD